MKRLVKIVITSIILLLLCALGVWFVVRVPNKLVPNKLANIPPTAIWRGAEDEGFWFDLVTIKQNSFRMRVYNDYNGAVVLDADFSDSGLCKQHLDKNIMDSICYFEFNKTDSIRYFGFNKIVLNNGCEFKAVYPPYGGTFSTLH